MASSTSAPTAKTLAIDAALTRHSLAGSGLAGPLPRPARRLRTPKKVRGLAVCMVPYCDDNPYQSELVRELENTGITVETRGHLKGLVRARLSDNPRVDVVHIHWLRVFSYQPLVVIRFCLFLLRILSLRALGCGVVWTVHNLHGHEARHHWMERLIARVTARCASQLIVHSPTAGKMVAQEFGEASGRKIVVVPHGNYIGCYPNSVTREEARQRLNLPLQSTVLLFLGKIRPYKGVRELISSFQSLGLAGAELVVAGSPLNQEVEAQVRAAVTSPHVHLHPRFIADEDIQLFMNAADAVVLPYQDVLTSGAVVLAMSFGKACIAAKIGSIGDVLDESGAILYDPSQPGALSGALEQALASPERLHAMGTRNEAVAREWGWDRIARETADVYRRSLA